MKKLQAILLGFGIWSLVIVFLPSPSSAATCSSVPGASCEPCTFTGCDPCPAKGLEKNTAYVCPGSPPRSGIPNPVCCVPAGTSNPSCGSFGGSCQSGCPGGTYEKLGTDCSSSTPNCCIALGGGGSSAFCDPGTNTQVRTALGCIPLEGTAFVNAVLPWGVGIASGIALVMIGYSGFILVTSSGDPKRVQAGRELLTAAVAGLILIALSVILLNFIGINILRLGGLGFNI